jgi:hypothetical protein
MKRCVLFVLVVIFVGGCTKAKKERPKDASEPQDPLGLQLIQQDGKYGYVDMNGEIVIEPQFYDAGQFNDGRARIKTQKKLAWGYIDSSGKTVIPAQFQGASDFRNGKAVVLNDEKFSAIAPDGSRIGFYFGEPSRRMRSPGDSLFVFHPSGLELYSTPESTGSLIDVVPYGERVVLLYDTEAKQFETLEALKGEWTCVRYHNRKGYLFGVYLTRALEDQEREVVEARRVVVDSRDDDLYSVFTVTKYATGRYATAHETTGGGEREEIVPNATVEEILAKLKSNPSDELGALIQFFTGETGTYTMESGEKVSILVKRDAEGFFDSVGFTKTGEEEELNINVARYNNYHVAINIIATVEE